MFQRFQFQCAVFVFVSLFVFSPTAWSAEGLFGSVEFKSNSIDAIPKWTNVLKRIEKDKKSFYTCDRNSRQCSNNSMSAWRDFVKDFKGDKPTQLTLRRVNEFINRWPYINDHSNWNRNDYWETPSEFLSRSGDCEDFAIIKYVTLKELGVKEDDMRIAVVMDDLRLIYHAVLIVYDENGKPFVLDSLFDAVLPHEDVLQYTPHYSVNEKARWAHVMPIKKR